MRNPDAYATQHIFSSTVDKSIARPVRNSIGESFSKIRYFLRKAGAHMREALVMKAMGQALEVASANDARDFFAHCGYRTPVELL